MERVRYYLSLIHIWDSSGTCSLVDFDPESGKAVFLVQVRQMNGEKIEGQKLSLIHIFPAVPSGREDFLLYSGRSGR